MRILYTAGNREGSYLQLKRYLPLFKSSNHQFKIAGYKRSVKDLNIDYCLDSLLDFTNEKAHISFNGNYNYYCKEISKFAPDLIISDFDLHTSLVAIEKNIPLWQISPALLYYGLSDELKRASSVHKFSSGMISGDRRRHQYIKHILRSSERKIITSHFCDIEGTPELEPGYEWCRPSLPQIKQVNRTVVEGCGLAPELSDAFYNEQYILLKPPADPDIETIAGISLSCYYGTGQLKSNRIEIKKINIRIDEKVKFLEEILK